MSVDAAKQPKKGNGIALQGHNTIHNNHAFGFMVVLRVRAPFLPLLPPLDGAEGEEDATSTLLPLLASVLAADFCDGDCAVWSGQLHQGKQGEVLLIDQNEGVHVRVPTPHNSDT